MHYLGTIEEIGGEERLRYLVEAWSDREVRAIELARMMLAVRLVAQAATEQEHAREAVLAAVDRLNAAIADLRRLGHEDGCRLVAVLKCAGVIE